MDKFKKNPKNKKKKKKNRSICHVLYFWIKPEKGLITIALTPELLPNYQYNKITNTITMMMMIMTHISSSGSQSSKGQTNQKIYRL
jgi:hypothetical protein